MSEINILDGALTTSQLGFRRPRSEFFAPTSVIDMLAVLATTGLITNDELKREVELAIDDGRVSADWIELIKE